MLESGTSRLELLVVGGNIRAARSFVAITFDGTWPDAESGEEIKAFVIRKPGATLGETELIAWVRERVAAYKYPRQVEFRDALPMTASGKILKRELVAK